jgi:precorrin-2 dehydrogenase/sirohydrochlorin ferrochelatase
VNLADRPDLSDFHVPAIHRRGPLLVSVSTGGATPGLARAIRERLADDLDDAVVQWIQLVAELRPLILERATPQDATGLLARLADWRWVERIRADGVEAVGRAMGDELKPLD